MLVILAALGINKTIGDHIVSSRNRCEYLAQELRDKYFKVLCHERSVGICDLMQQKLCR